MEIKDFVRVMLSDIGIYAEVGQVVDMTMSEVYVSFDGGPSYRFLSSELEVVAK